MKTFPADWPAEACADYFLSEGWTLGGSIEKSVLAWFAGQPCPDSNPAHRWDSHYNDSSGRLERYPCPKCFADPPAEFGRDVLAAFVLQGGAAHPRQVEMAEEARRWMIEPAKVPAGTAPLWRIEWDERQVDWHHSEAKANLAMKRRILRLFSGPVEDEKCSCEGTGNDFVRLVVDGEIDSWQAGNEYDKCRRCNGSGIIPGGGVRIEVPEFKSDSYGNPRPDGTYVYRWITPEQQTLTRWGIQT